MSEIPSSGLPTNPRRALSRRDMLRGSVAAGAVLATGAIRSGSTPGTAPRRADPLVTPRRGGNLRVAVLGGSSSDTIDAQKQVVLIDTLRVLALYNGLVTLALDGKSVELELAEELTPSKDAKTWTVRLKPGLLFHNGKDVTAEDIIYSFQRILNPKDPLEGEPAIHSLEYNGFKALDKRTVRFTSSVPFATLPLQLTDSYSYGIIPVGYDPKRPIGTGPFKYKSFTPGQQSVFTRNEHYYESGFPYLDQLTILDFSDDNSAYNALLTNEIDVFAEAALPLASQARGQGLTALVSKTGQWTPFTMRVDQEPFKDVRVRQAFRYIVDRKQLVADAFDGFAAIGNDIFGNHDPCYDSSLKRHQDVDKAKFLLKQAGRENLQLELVTANFATGVVESAEVFQQNAKAANVDIQIRQLTTGDFYGPNYLKWIFAQDFWGYNPYLSQAAQSNLPVSIYNECHFDNERYYSLYKAANSTLDAAKRCEIQHEMEVIDYNEGGYIIGTYNKTVDLMRGNVHGFPEGATGVALGSGSFELAWIS